MFPTAWGEPLSGRLGGGAGQVFPTGVGVNRRLRNRVCRISRAPTGVGVNRKGATVEDWDERAPHGRGGEPVSLFPLGQLGVVLPTGVGVNRLCQRCRNEC